MTDLHPSDAEALATEWETLSSDEIVARAVELFGDQIALACSFQKEESVLVDMLANAADQPRVFAIDTGVLFDETLTTWRRFEEHFGLSVEVADATDSTGTGWTAERCCSEAKVAALDHALSGLDAWITGIRREQSPTRAGTRAIEYDAGRQIWKINPIAGWDERDLWNRIFERSLPYHPLHDEGYSSIGCEPCTMPGSGREGRWSGSAKTECGLHVSPAEGVAVDPISTVATTHTFSADSSSASDAPTTAATGR